MLIDNTVKDFLSHVLQERRDIPQEKADAVSSDFLTGLYMIFVLSAWTTS